MERWIGKVAIVTGASAGIGLGIAKALVQNGMIVVGLARRLEKMQDEMQTVSGPGTFYAKRCDVQRESEIKEVFDWVDDNFHTAHVLVNNAGCYVNTTLENMKPEDMRHVIDVNLVGYLVCAQYAMKIMKKNDHEAHIININGVLGHKVPLMKDPLNVYTATKHAITAFCQTLIHELAGTKIRVTSISPGATEDEEYMTKKMSGKVIEEKPRLKPEDVANSVLHVISVPQHVQITELMIKPLGQLYYVQDIKSTDVIIDCIVFQFSK